MTTDPTLPSAPLPDLDALTALGRAAFGQQYWDEASWTWADFAGCQINETQAKFLETVCNNWPALLSALTATRAELGRANRELNERRAHECVPTQDAYDKACAALWKHRERADTAVRERDAARAELARVTEQRDTANATLSRANDEHSRLSAKIREQYDVIEHAKRQRDTALGELEQTRAQLAEMREQRDQYRKNWDGCREGNMRAAETIHTLKTQRHRVLNLCATTPDVELDALPQRVREVYEEAAPAAAPRPDEQLTTPCVAAELNVPHPAHVVSEKGNVACEGAVAGTGQQDTATAQPDRCHLPVQEGKPCGLFICRKGGCRAARTGTTPAAVPAGGDGTGGGEQP